MFAMLTAAPNLSLARKYLAEAQRLLPRIGIDDNPGDGGADRGKRTRLDLIDLYIDLARVQKAMGESAAARATLGRTAQNLLRVRGQVYQRGVDNLVEAYLKLGMTAEGVSLSRRYDIDGYRASLIAPYQSGKEAEAILLNGLAQASKLPDKQEQAARAFDIWEAGKGLPVVREKAQAMLLPLLEQLPTDAGDVAVAWCRAVYLGMPVDAAQAEKRLVSTTGDQLSLQILGRCYLKQDAQARAAMARASQASQLPRRLIDFVKPEELIAVARRIKSTDVLTDAVKYLRDKRPDVQWTLLQAAERIDASVVGGSYYSDVVRHLPSSARTLREQARRRAKTLLAREIAESEGYFKQHPVDRSSFEDTTREAQWADTAAACAPIDTALALRCLAKVKEPRWRVAPLIALANAASSP